MAGFSKERLPKVSPESWDGIDAFFRKDRRMITPGDIVDATGLPASQALALLDCLANDKAVTLICQGFHVSCEFPKAPVLRRPIAQGLPNFPIQCTACERDLNAEDVSFEIAAQVVGALPRFVDDT